VGKPVAIISDARLSGRTDAAVVTERLLSISGEDAVTFDRKNLPHLTAKLTTRFTLLSNELPRLHDASGALASRVILLRLLRSWYGKEDHDLTARLLSELPGILLWAIAGWQRLYERGHFEQPESSRTLLEDLEDLTSPIGEFVRECCVLETGAVVPVDDIFGKWKWWCETKNRMPGDEQNFGKDLLANVPTIHRKRPRKGEERYRAYENIRLRW
jgi:putative DNA primase/helicase